MPRKIVLLVGAPQACTSREARMLEDWGYGIVVVQSAEQALDVFKTQETVALGLAAFSPGYEDSSANAARIVYMTHKIPFVVLAPTGDSAALGLVSDISVYGLITRDTEAAVSKSILKLALELAEARAAIDSPSEHSFLEQLLETIPLPIFVKDLRGVYTHVNKAYAELYGVDEDCIKGNDVFGIYPHNEAAVIQAKDEELYRSGGVQNHEITLQRPQGSAAIHVLIHKFLLADGRGCPTGILGIAVDITERKLAESRIQKLVEERDILLKEVHHRIKNNMSVIYSLLSIQAQDSQDILVRSALEDAAGRVMSMQMLFDKLYRSENYEEVRLSEYLSELIKSVIGNFPNSYRVHPRIEIVDIVIDSKRIATLGIIMNELITNVMKYAFPKGQSGLISVTASMTDSGYISISVRDDGVGMPPEIHVKDGFSGLALIEALAKQLGGTMRIESGMGTNVTVAFPLLE